MGGFGAATLHCTGWAAAEEGAGGHGADAEGEGEAETEDDGDEGADGAPHTLQQSAAHAAGRARGATKGALADAGRFLRKRAVAGQANLKRMLGREPRPRLPPSAADASALAGKSAG